MSFVGSNILAGASGQGGSGYEIERSLRFNSGDSAHLSRGFSAGNRKTWTWSGWIKRTDFGTRRYIFTNHTSNGTNCLYFEFDASNRIHVGDYATGSYNFSIITTAVYRDPSAWYHVVLAFDTTQATASDRVKIYVNNSQVTAFDTSNYPSQNYDGYVNQAATHAISYLQTYYGDFYLADLQFIDGQALAPTDFGETDDNGVWQPKKFEGSYNSAGSNTNLISETTSSNGFSSSNPVENMFDGSTTTTTENNASTTTNYITWTPTTPIQNVTSLRVYATLNSNQYDAREVSVNGGTYYNPNVYGTTQWWDLIANTQFNSGDTLTEIKFQARWFNGGAPSCVVRAIEVNGVIQQAVPGGVNGFHLDFSDNSSNAALGTDTSGNNNTWTVNNLNVSGLSGTNSGNSWYFNGNNNTSITANDSDLALGNGDWTVEMFIKPESGVNGQSALTSYNSNHPIFETDSSLKLRWFTSSTYDPGLSTGTWYHIAWVRHGSNGYIYLNGNRIANRSYSEGNLTNSSLAIGNRVGNGVPWKGLISNVHIVVGTALYTGGTYPIPFTPITTVANTKLLTCHSSTLTDGSGNNITLANNGATVSNEVPSGSASGTNTTPGIDSLVDTPTNGTQTDTGAGGEVVGNYATWNPLEKHADITLSNGNLEASTSSSWKSVLSNIGMTSGKWYCEFTVNNIGQIGVCGSASTLLGTYLENDPTAWVLQTNAGNVYKGDGGQVSTGVAWATGDIVNIAYDRDTTSIWFGKNGTWVLSGNPASGTNPVVTNAGPGNTGRTMLFGLSVKTGSGGSINFGSRPFAYPAPSGYKSINTANLPEPTIEDGSKYFDTKLYTGNSSTNTITSLQFSPDLVWLKSRGNAYSNQLYDTIRGATKALFSNLANGTSTETTALTAFTSDGFTLGDDLGLNANNVAHVAWAWDGGDLVTNSAYDQSQAWSTFGDSNAKPNENWTHVFDGNETAGPHVVANSGSTTVWTPSTAITFTKLEIYANNDGYGDITLNGSISTTGTVPSGGGSSIGWANVTSLISNNTLTSIEVPNSYNSDPTRLGAIKVDDKYLLDPGVIPAGGLNSSVYNQSRTWSDDWTGNFGGYDPAEGFNGSVTSGNITVAYPSGSSGITLTVSPAISGSVIRVLYSRGNANAPASINGTETLPVTGTGGTYVWHTLTATSISSVTLTHDSVGSSYMRAIEVDGKLLVNSGVTPPSVPSIASTVRANPSAGFSIVKYNAISGGGSVGHGLSSDPQFIIVKRLDATENWCVYSYANGNDAALFPNTTASRDAHSSYWNDTDPNSSVFTLGSSGNVSHPGDDYIAYCFSPVEGYSAMGSYTGNGSADGAFIYTGFAPSWLLFKRYDSSSDWTIYDTARDPHNVAGDKLEPNTNDAESAEGAVVDILSNGFKFRRGSLENGGNDQYIYMAFASHPFKTSRAR